MDVNGMERKMNGSSFTIAYRMQDDVCHKINVSQKRTKEAIERDLNAN